MNSLHVTSDDKVASSRGVRISSIALILLAGIVSFPVLLIRLDARYLWQDEAMTAVLGERLIKLGKPFAYDGHNLLTVDIQNPEEEAVFEAQTVSADKAVDYFTKRGDFKSDTSWTGHPWGQFLLSGISTHFLGKTTFAARLPFVLAAVLTMMLLAEWMENVFKSHSMTIIAVLLLLGNVFWFVHVRQCRYYSLSSLFVLMSMRCYWSWLEGRLWGAVGMILSTLLLFNSDFGTYWPLMAALFTYAWIDRAKSPVAIMTVFTISGLATLPFFLFYEIQREIFDRIKSSTFSLHLRFLGEVFQVNQYVLPFLVIALAIYLMPKRSDLSFRPQRRVLEPVLLFAALLVIVQSLVIPFPFHRYIVSLTPIATIVIAWTLVTGAKRLTQNNMTSQGIAFAGALLILVSPIMSSPVSAFLPAMIQPRRGNGLFLRPELTYMKAEIFGTSLVDPNRATIEFLRTRMKPGDEVMINYEEMPAMFYLDANVLGGNGCFRVGERTGPPPRFVVIRKTAPFHPYQWKVVKKFLDKCRLKQIKAGIPDTTWGNCPDPLINYVELGQPKEEALVYETTYWK